MMAINPDKSGSVDPKRCRDFDLLTRNGYKRIYGLAYSMLGNPSEAEDATQETFVRAWRHFDLYDRKHPFQNWLSAIARNFIKDHFRKRRIRTHVSLDFLTDSGFDVAYHAIQTPDGSEDPASTVLSNETFEICRSAVARIHEPFQSVLTLHDFDGHSYSEIARMLQCPMGTVRSRLHRGRALVRQAIERYHPAIAETSS